MINKETYMDDLRVLRKNLRNSACSSTVVNISLSTIDIHLKMANENWGSRPVSQSSHYDDNKRLVDHYINEADNLIIAALALFGNDVK